MPALTEALRYAGQGHAVLPCIAGTEEPAATGGVYSATTDVDQLEQWWRWWPDANVAVAARPSELAFADLDRRANHDGVANFGRLLESLELDWPATRTTATHWPATRTTATPSDSRHLWFTRPAGIDLTGWPTTTWPTSQPQRVHAERCAAGPPTTAPEREPPSAARTRDDDCRSPRERRRRSRHEPRRDRRAQAHERRPQPACGERQRRRYRAADHTRRCQHQLAWLDRWQRQGDAHTVRSAACRTAKAARGVGVGGTGATSRTPLPQDPAI